MAQWVLAIFGNGPARRAALRPMAHAQTNSGLEFPWLQ